VRITTVTELEKSWGQDVIRRRLEPLRESISQERDDWSVRFAQVNPESERVTLERTRGELVRAEHSGVINRQDLARFFGDLPMTLTVARGDGWTELAIYPGSSSRASRQQREVVEGVLDLWTHETASYFTRMSRLYEWMDQHPQMVEQAFALLFDDNETAHAVDEEEERPRHRPRATAMSAVTERLQPEREGADADRRAVRPGPTTPSPPRSRSTLRGPSSAPSTSTSATKRKSSSPTPASSTPHARWMGSGSPPTPWPSSSARTKRRPKWPPPPSWPR